MKLSEVFAALEERKTVAEVLGGSLRKYHKLVTVSDGIERLASWWHDEPQKLDFSNYVHFNLGRNYEVTQA